MKTLQIMESPDRLIDGIQTYQDTNFYFNATKFLDAYNKKYSKKNRLQSFLENRQTKRFMEALQEELLSHSTKSGDDDFNLIRAKRGSHSGTWMNPYLFLKFAMWLSPKLEAKVHIMLVDHLILFRHQCGDGYKILSKAIQERNPLALPSEYRAEANMINTIVFGKPDGKQRNGASEEQLRLLEQVQKVDVKLMDKGLDYPQRFKKLLAFREYLE